MYSKSGYRYYDRKDMGMKKKKKSLAERKANPRSDYWDSKAETEWKRVVRARANNTCEKCGQSWRKMDCHHLIGRGEHLLRWNPDNGILLCGNPCHCFGKGSAHKDPVVFSQWLKLQYPEKWDWVQDNKWPVTKNKPDYQADYEYLKEL